MTELRIATDDLFMRAHADGTITAQFPASIGCRAEPDVQTLSPPRGHYGFLDIYAGTPGLSLDLHRDDVVEIAGESIRRDALTIIEELTAEVWDNRHRVRSG